MGNHGAVSAVDRPRALLCWPFQHGARLSSLVLAFPAWCSGWVDLVRSLRLQIRSERRLLVFAPSVGVGESLRQLAALAARRACSVRRRTARESERRRRKNVENGVDWCTCYLRRVHAGIHVLRVRPHRVWTLPRLLTGSLVSTSVSTCRKRHMAISLITYPFRALDAARWPFALRLLPPFLAAKPASYIASW